MLHLLRRKERVREGRKGVEGGGKRRRKKGVLKYVYLERRNTKERM